MSKCPINEIQLPEIMTHYLVKSQCLKVTIESKTSETTHFKQITTGNNMFNVSVTV